MGSRYVIMSSPAFALGLGVGIDALRCWKKPVAALAALLLVAAMGVSTYRYFTHPAYRTKEDYGSAARLVMAREAAGDAILLTAPENITAFAHYYQGRLPVFPVPSVALSGPQRPERIEADLARRGRAGLPTGVAGALPHHVLRSGGGRHRLARVARAAA